MKNNQQKLTHPQKQSVKILSQLQALQLEQLDGIYGGSDPEWKYVPVRRYR